MEHVQVYQPKHKVRIVTAASLFDGHDAAINVMRRLIQAQGAEVIHLGHNRSVRDIVRAALQEDADGIAISSYQGGHVEFFRYMVDMLNEAGAGHIRVFGGGGGTITLEEIKELQEAKKASEEKLKDLESKLKASEEENKKLEGKHRRNHRTISRMQRKIATR